jgi:ATP-dependent protease HslVU (ClpYQ) peptidase subunit
MTCIIAIKKDKKIYLAGDRRIIEGQMRHEKASPKVFKNGDLMIGVCGGMYMPQLLQYCWEVPKKNVSQSDDEYIYKTISLSVKKLFDDNGFFKNKDTSHYPYGHFMICYSGRMFSVGADMGICELNGPIDTMGSGGEIALIATRIYMEYESDIEKIFSNVFRKVSELHFGVSKEYDYIYEDIK